MSKALPGQERHQGEVSRPNTGDRPLANGNLRPVSAKLFRGRPPIPGKRFFARRVCSRYNFPVNRLEAFGYIAAQAARGESTFPTSVNAALRLQLALDDPDCHIEDAIKLVLGEPQLAARTVALANSAAFNRNGDAPSPMCAPPSCGSATAACRPWSPAWWCASSAAKIVDPELRAKAEQLWEHTAHVAALAQVLARKRYLHQSRYRHVRRHRARSGRLLPALARR